MTQAASMTDAGILYLDRVEEILDDVRRTQWPRIRQAAALVAEAIAGGHEVHAFGTGHSHMLAEELFYRAGGLVRVRPLLFEGLMLHASAPLSTALERLPGLADALVADHGVHAGDVVIVASNSGGNAVTTELVRSVHERGAVVIAVTSIAHATSEAARDSGLPRLHEAADIVIDNGGAVGDAAVDIPGVPRRVGPTSTVAGAAILNAVVVQTAGLLADRGVVPEIYASSNTREGDAINAGFAPGAAA
ncbi:sugar isomerase domain-containing protein [Leucobacter soli]|uniref:SIS domain-containing protein n=1 Tax=Leucobacter soli TaxID=2812850 RepID=A0A916K1P1_9MICO|nr:SIS domain-containing protein [Leucobacter soli]CAG7621430.1 hypothetical protein LEUCIP111803_02431 [Leucobacter soli]